MRKSYADFYAQTPPQVPPSFILEYVQSRSPDQQALAATAEPKLPPSTPQPSPPKRTPVFGDFTPKQMKDAQNAAEFAYQEKLEAYTKAMAAWNAENAELASFPARHAAWQAACNEVRRLETDAASAYLRSLKKAQTQPTPPNMKLGGLAFNSSEHLSEYCSSITPSSGGH